MLADQLVARCIPMPRRFPPPWSIEERQESFIVKDANGQALAYLYFEDEPQRQMSMKRLSRDEAFLLAVNIAKAAKLAAADIEGHSPAAKFSQPGRLSARPRALLRSADPVERVAVLPLVTIVKAGRPRLMTLAGSFRDGTVCTMNKPLKHDGSQCVLGQHANAGAT
jgi:hypothetical protein